MKSKVGHVYIIIALFLLKITVIDMLRNRTINDNADKRIVAAGSYDSRNIR